MLLVEVELLIMSTCSTFTQIVLKQFVGGFRPHYLELCKPDVNRLKDSIQDVSSRILFMDPLYCTCDVKILRHA